MSDGVQTIEWVAATASSGRGASVAAIVTTRRVSERARSAQAKGSDMKILGYVVVGCCVAWIIVTLLWWTGVTIPDPFVGTGAL